MEIRDRILVAAADRGLAAFCKNILTAERYEVHSAADGESACTQAAAWCPQLLLLAASLPDLSALEVIERIRSWATFPIIVLADHAEASASVTALDAGADDFLALPCRSQELLARIRAALRRVYAQGSAGSDAIVIGGLRIDHAKRRVYVNGRDAGLTQNEYRILTTLARNAGSVVTYDMLLREVWGPNMRSDNRILRVNMPNIRRKIEADPAHPRYVFTLGGVGYQMAES